MKSFKTFRLAVATAAFLAAGAASAERPASLAGTTWTVQTNRDAVQLVIETQGGAGDIVGYSQGFKHMARLGIG